MECVSWEVGGLGGIVGRRTSGGHVLGRQDALDGDKWDLHAGSRTDTREQLVSDPLAGIGVHVQGVQHPGSDGEDGRAEPHEWRVEPDAGDGSADDDGREGDADEIGDRADA